MKLRRWDGTLSKRGRATVSLPLYIAGGRRRQQILTSSPTATNTHGRVPPL